MRTPAMLCAANLLACLVLCSAACGDGDGSDQGKVDGGGSEERKDGGDGEEGEFVSFPSETTCGLAIHTEGALAVDVGTSSKPGCLVQVASGSGVDASFLYREGDLAAVQLQIPPLKEGQTGKVAAVVALASGDGGQWESEDCLATINEHEYLRDAELGGKSYRLVGSLRCEPAQPDSEGAQGSVEIASLSFVITMTWN
jgi:hypothetical protein